MSPRSPFVHDESGDFARQLLEAASPARRDRVARGLAREIAQAETRREMEDRILANADQLDHEDHSDQAEGIRETAGSIRDHRAMDVRRFQWRRQSEAARTDHPKPAVTKHVTGEIDIVYAGRVIATLNEDQAGRIAEQLLMHGGLRNRVRTGRRLHGTVD